MKLNRLVGQLAVLGLAAHAGAVLAQSEAGSKLERVEVTGSSIKRLKDEGALPIQVISRKDLERQGIVSAEQLISTLSVNGNGLDNLASNADVVAGQARGNNGASSANLRGQGAASTLILLNGRRVAAHGLNGGVVDLQQIPFAAVERVEILKDGASAIYGTDAIGGVINFILRKNYEGLEAQAFTDVTQAGGGNISTLKLTGGWGNLERDKFNVLASLAYSDSQMLRGDQRSFVNTFQPSRGLSVDTRGTPYATVFTLSSLATALSNKSSAGPIQPGTTVAMNGINALDLPGQAGCASIEGQAAYDEVLWATPSAKWGCAWDTGRAAVLQQPVKSTNAVVRGTLALGEHQLFAEFVGAHVVTDKSFSPNQISSSSSASNPFFFNLAYPSTGTAYNSVFNAIAAVFPTIEKNRGLPLALRWRCMPCGNREIETTSDTKRLLVGADGPLFGGWDYKTGVSMATSDTTSLLKHGYFYGKPFAALINNGTLNPFPTDGITQTADALKALDAVRADGVTLYGGKFTLTQADFTASGPVMKLPAGDMMAAIGTDVRTEKYKFNGNATDAATQATIFNAPFDSVNTLDTVKRDVKAVFGEVLVPVFKGFEASAAVRHDSYTGFGGTTNPKFSLRYQPFEQLLVRASTSRGFRVPTFNQLYNGTTESPYSGKDLADPGKCPGGVVDPTKPGCESVTPTILTGGKSTLGPEKSKQWTWGLVWSPVPDVAVSADWWQIRKTGTIQSVALSDMVKNYALFTDNFQRDASGTLQAIDNRWVNAGETITKGLDLSARGTTQLGTGRLTVNMEGTYLLDKRSRLLASAPMGASEIGVFTRAGDLGLRWKHSLTFVYAEGDWATMFQQLWRAGYKDAQLPGVANGSIVPPEWKPNVSKYVTYNASVSYTGIKNLGLTFGIKNLLNDDPPFSAAYDGNTGAGSSWEPRVADPRGRSYTFTVNYKFW
ncbi:TonB-dependent receptor [Pelomonas sp. P7]|uniref:TonB-dependent receptor n=1 Tax=Pelomonas caseinilytica TaxID=2906763 RepID=A0ABS8XGQ1_9BURK|nr:TonB-dependent receptor [Pelomonas sp. P7]MCE4538913.1 TonB-dependent receptor [Pelomonas sp. P7]